MISAGAVRVITLVVCALGIAGMIVTSILNHNGAAVTFGLITAVAILCSMVAKSVAANTERALGLGPAGSAPGRLGSRVAPGGRGGADAGPAAASDESEPATADVDALAELVEGQVQAVVAAGAEEAAVRQLVGEAVRLGRALAPLPSAQSRSH